MNKSRLFAIYILSVLCLCNIVIYIVKYLIKRKINKSTAKVQPIESITSSTDLTKANNIINV